MNALLLTAWVSVASGGSSDGSAIYSAELSTSAGTAIIVQSGPNGTKPFVYKTRRPGFSILQQKSGGNSAIIIQQQSGD